MDRICFAAIFAEFLCSTPYALLWTHGMHSSASSSFGPQPEASTRKWQQPFPERDPMSGSPLLSRSIVHSYVHVGCCASVASGKLIVRHQPARAEPVSVWRTGCLEHYPLCTLPAHQRLQLYTYDGRNLKVGSLFPEGNEPRRYRSAEILHLPLSRPDLT